MRQYSIVNKTHPGLIILLAVMLLIPASAHCAEVFYLAGSQSGAQNAGRNPDYSLKDRAYDLFDFTSGRPLEQRSGRISGSVLQEINWQKIGGNKQKSFLKVGTHYLTEINLNIQEKLWGNYNFDTQMFIRKTDNPRIEPRKDVRLKQLTVNLRNPNNLFQFGDFYGELSQFTLGSSLEGFNIEVSPKMNQKYHLIVARKNEADEAANLFQRDVFGAKADYTFFEQLGLFNFWRMGAQVASSVDDTSSLERLASTAQLKNIVAGFDGELAFKKYFSVGYEFARSSYIANAYAENKDTNFGNAFRVQPVLTIDKLNLRYLYNYTNPQFNSETGSAQPDKIQHQVTLDYRFNQKMSFTFVENYYWDHLERSSQTKRTTNDEQYYTLIFRPFDKRKDFTFRPYASNLAKNSDDVLNSAESITRTIGFSINDALNEKTTAGMNYEYRGFVDQANHSTSEHFHRFGLNLGREQQVFSRRLYASGDITTDIRTAKNVNNKNDVTIGVSLNGQYDLLKSCISRFGYNVQDTNSASPDTNFVNYRTFLEFDFKLAPKHNTHFILRGEHNDFKHHDGEQDYDETRFISKFLTAF